MGLELGTFRARHRPEALCFAAFWRLGRAQAKGDGRLEGMNPDGDSDQAIWSRSNSRAGERGGARTASEMGEDLGSSREDVRDDSQGPPM